MKIEITPENKARFFALYWGQKVLVAALQGGGKKTYTVQASEMHDHYFEHKCWLNLKPLSAISDEEDLIMSTAYGVTGKVNIMDPIQFDFLRSRGYALPWMGLSVEELIAAGWVKLIEI